MRVLVVNAGSTSLKLSAVDPADGRAEDLGADIAAAAQAAGPLLAVGHRVVHGGTRFAGPVRIDDAVRHAIAELTPLAPLHQPAALAGIDAARAALPRTPQVACFDTAFHRGLPAEAHLYALPAEWRERLAARRYGFHGLSLAHAVPRAAGLLGRAAADLRLVVCHLGGGASVTAVHGGASADTTMGYSPMEGLVMASRSGSVDPAIVIALVRAGLSAGEVEKLLDRRSGLLALTGTADMREVVDRAEAGDPEAEDALALYCHRVRAGIAAAAAAMGGVDAVVFSGGVGERAPVVRARACDRLGFLGLRLDTSRNAAADGSADVRIDDDGPVAALVIHAREDLVIAREAARVARGG